MWNGNTRIRYSWTKNIGETGLPGVVTHRSKIVAGIVIHGGKFSGHLLLFMYIK